MDKKPRRNEDILDRLSEKDPLAGLGCTYKPYVVRLFSQDMKNYYENYFGHASRSIHFIHFHARSSLPNNIVAAAENNLKESIRHSTQQVDDAIVGCEMLMKENGILLDSQGAPSCSPPLVHTAKVISPLSNRYVQLLEKTDYAIRALDALFVDEVVTIEDYVLRRQALKSYVRHFYRQCRHFDYKLRDSMNEAASQMQEIRKASDPGVREVLPETLLPDDAGSARSDHSLAGIQGPLVPAGINGWRPPTRITGEATLPPTEEASQHVNPNGAGNRPAAFNNTATKASGNTSAPHQANERKASKGRYRGKRRKPLKKPAQVVEGVTG